MSSEASWWVVDYAADIHEYLRKKEKQRATYHSQSPQLRMRRYLVDWMGIICERMKLSTIVQHVAICLLDFFMDNHNIQSEHLHLAALSCLLLAAKSEEKDMYIPKTSDMNKMVNNAYMLREYIQMEIIILNYFEWKILVPTAAHFIEYYAQLAVSPADWHAGTPIKSINQANVFAKQYSAYFLDTSLQDHVFLRYPPSLVAASCVAATRISLILSPMWPLSLQKRTQYKFEQLATCVELLLKNLEIDEKAAKHVEKTEAKEESSSSYHSSESPSTSTETSPSSDFE